MSNRAGDEHFKTDVNSEFKRMGAPLLPDFGRSGISGCLSPSSRRTPPSRPTTNRSALEWIIDQYQVSTDKRSGITNDPNREDDPQYIFRLIGQVITVSLETMKLIKGLPQLHIHQQTSIQAGNGA